MFRNTTFWCHGTINELLKTNKCLPLGEKLPMHLILDVRSSPTPRDPEDQDRGLYFRVTNLLEYSTMSNTGFVVTETAVKALGRFGQVTIEDWIHICVSVDAVTGQTLVVANGEVAFNEKNEFLANSRDKMPATAVNSVWFYGEKNPVCRVGCSLVDPRVKS